MAELPSRLTFRQAAVDPLLASLFLGAVVVAVPIAFKLDGLGWLWLLTIWAAVATVWTRRRGLDWPLSLVIGTLAVGATLLSALTIFAVALAVECRNGCG